jgi:hypothetical protein
MHPISIRGRSMSPDRQTLRAILVIMALLCSSLSTGCLRSTMLRPADEPVAQPALAGGPPTPARAPSAVPASTPTPGPAAMPPTELQPAPTPVQDQAGETPAANPTPLMDAAIERVAAVTQQQHESLDPATFPSESDEHVAKAVAPDIVAVVRAAPVQQPPPTRLPVADTAESSPEVAPTGTKPIVSPTQPAVPTVPNDRAQQIGLETPTKISIVAEAEPAAPMRETAGSLLNDSPPAAANVPPVANEVDPLSIGKLCLCRKILGFGSFEPRGESRVKAGQQILLYCEMTGMQYEPKDASFVSRLSSNIEIGSIEKDTFQWARQFGPEDDVCASRRHDFFVNYKFSVPTTLPPGSYRLRLTQTDLVANRSTSAEIPILIVP